MSSVSVGGHLRVWATGRDGSAWYRDGVTNSSQTGTCWYHVPPPSGVVLRQISAGDSEVYAVDKTSTSHRRLLVKRKIFVKLYQNTYFKDKLIQ